MSKLDRLKELHSRFSKLPLEKEECNKPEYGEYIEAIHENEEFSNWVLTSRFDANSFDYSPFCCLQMADRVFQSLDKNGEIKYDDVDIVINKWRDGTYGIPIHDGGTSIIRINFCPWCGTKLN